jgi:ComF family protein
MFSKFIFKAPLSSSTHAFEAKRGREFFAQITSYFRTIQNILLPSECILCSMYTLNTFSLCNDCFKDLPILPQRCIRCAKFIKINEDLGKLICGDCLRTPPSFAQTYALFPYQEPISSLLIQLKFHHKLYIARAFAELMLEKIKSEWYPSHEFPHLIIPIPLHYDRLRERGFNQALEIARPIAKTLHLPIDVTGVKRVKNTEAQSGLQGQERKENLINAFVAQKDYSQLYIAVLDDVVTTGHTIREFCKVLKQSGAKRIDVWCGARNG